MISIDGIDYSVILLVDKADGKQVQEMVFADFYEMNDFIRRNKDFPQYKACHVDYALVETSDNGSCDSYSWTEPIDFKEFSEEDIRKAIEDQRNWMIEIAEHNTQMDNHMKSINFITDDMNYLQKRPYLEEFAYVCPFCIREIEDCRCKHYPYYLIQIDRMILPIIRELNTKGYKTTGCCAGHPTLDEFKASGIYICFDQDYDFDEPIPDNATYFRNNHCLRITPTIKNYENLNAFQQEAIWKLSDWVEMLSDLDK